MELFESLLALGIGLSAILFSKRWIKDSRESLNQPTSRGALAGYQRLYAPYLKGRWGEVMKWFVRIIGVALVCAGVIGLFQLVTR